MEKQSQYIVMQKKQRLVVDIIFMPIDVADACMFLLNCDFKMLQQLYNMTTVMLNVRSIIL